MSIPFLGRVPLTLTIRRASDAGTPPAAGEGAESEIFAAIARRLLAQLAPAGPGEKKAGFPLPRE